MLMPHELALIAPIDARDSAMVRDLSEIVAMPTGMRCTEGLLDCRRWMRARLESLGAACHEEAGQPAPLWLREGSARVPANAEIPPLLVAERIRAGSLAHVLLCGHIDTVHDPAGSFRQLAVADVGTRAVGPGCSDMKGGLLVALEALNALEEANVPVSWTFLVVSDEETGSFHSDAALRRYGAGPYTCGLVFEPAMSDGGLVIERPGSGQFMIECAGRAAHVGRDFSSGISAVTALCQAVLRASQLADPAAGLIVSVGPVEGGIATNIVPDSARAWGNVRCFSARAESLVRSQLEELATPQGRLPSTRVECVMNRPSKPLTPGVQALANLAQQCAHDLRDGGRGADLPLGVTGGVCDGNNLQAAGLPVIDTLGVRGGGLHTTQEWIDLTSLTQRAQLTALLISRLVNRA